MDTPLFIEEIGDYVRVDRKLAHYLPNAANLKPFRAYLAAKLTEEF